jgi:hypothetical protein
MTVFGQSWAYKKHLAFMIPSILTHEEVMKVTRYGKSATYDFIGGLKACYPFSEKLKGAKVRTQDLCDYLGLTPTEIEDIINIVP